VSAASKLPRVACVAAFLLAGVTLLSVIFNSVAILPFTLVPLCAGVGILRRRAWGAYGMALYCFAQLIPVTVVAFRDRGSMAGAAGLLVSTVLVVGVGCFFLFAGRALARAGAATGRAAPWIAVSALTSLPVFFVQPFVIPTGAMEDTILVGDRILVQRFPKPAVARDDLVVFAYPPDRRQTFVKRVIGIPGDRIRIVTKAVYRNGTRLEEPYARHKTDYVDSYRDNFPSDPNIGLRDGGEEMIEKHVDRGEVVVPEGCYFVLGDNRDSSLDSRYWGFVRFADIIGKPRLIYDSRVQSTDSIMQAEPAAGRTRWDRLFRRL
jgi:signal peptidase I